MIHYHGTPFTPTADMVKSFASRHAMVSYAEPRQLEVAAEICQSIVLDNGAFTAWRQKQDYDFNGYVDWARQWLRHPAVDWCVIPDKIDGTEDENDLLLAEWPLQKSMSVPVWHLHESLERLERLMEYPRIALGSSGQYASVGTSDWWSRMDEAMNVICDNDGVPYVKLHGLRMLNPGVFSKIPLASADSCYVARNAGMDSSWKGQYAMTSRYVRAVCLMERIEKHASASHWSRDAIGVYHNNNLFG